jgi:putative alpha-1,2-mannosidase
MGLYPLYPGRADLVIGSPLFPEIRIDRPGAAIHIVADGAADDAPEVYRLTVNGHATSRPWLSDGFVQRGGDLHFSLSSVPDAHWGSAAAEAPPSYGPPK